MKRDDAIRLAGRAGFHVVEHALPYDQVRRFVLPVNVYCTDEAVRLVELAQIEERKRLDAQQMREMLRAMQAGELTVSRGVELIDMWLAGNYSDDQLPPVRDLGLGEDDMPADVIEKMRAQIAAPSAPKQDWPVLDKPALVGGGRFHVGVSARLVVEAAQRHYEYDVTPEKEAERVARASKAIDALVAPVQAVQEITEQLEACTQRLNALHSKYPVQAVPDVVVEALQSLKEQVAAIYCHAVGHPGTAMAFQNVVIGLIDAMLAAAQRPPAD